MHHITEILLGFTYIGISVTLFFESGVFLFFLPGDTLLLSAGIYASQLKLSFAEIVLYGSTASILGAVAGFYIGRHIAHKKIHAVFFTEKQIQKTELFFSRFGSYAVLLNRFAPIVRTIAPVVAGASGMSAKEFHRSNILGSFLWVSTVTAFGYFAGALFPGLEKLVPIILLTVITLSFLLLIVQYSRGRYKKNKI